MEYQDNKYQFAFQFPQDWKVQRDLSLNEHGEIRVIVRHPTRPIFAEVIVGQLDKGVTKKQYEANPQRDGLVDALMQFTVDQVYKNASRTAGAERMFVVEKKVIPSDAGIKFYVSTLQMKGDSSFGVFGLHIAPFGKPYILAFVIGSPVDKSVTEDNTTVTRVFQSFHVLGEQPVQ
jgi:hypothetical protein